MEKHEMKINSNSSAYTLRLKSRAIGFSYILLLNLMVSKSKKPSMPFIVLPSLPCD